MVRRPQAVPAGRRPRAIPAARMADRPQAIPAARMTHRPRALPAAPTVGRRPETSMARADPEVPGTTAARADPEAPGTTTARADQEAHGVGTLSAAISTEPLGETEPHPGAGVLRRGQRGVGRSRHREAHGWVAQSTTGATRKRLSGIPGSTSGVFGSSGSGFRCKPSSACSRPASASHSLTDQVMRWPAVPTDVRGTYRGRPRLVRHSCSTRFRLLA
jgi:hypothetical protein